MAIKVTQSQIDAIKKMGMTGALKGASGMSPAMKEGVRRLYGDRRFAAATKTSKPAAKSGNSSNYGVGAGKVAMPGRGPAVTMAKKSTPKTGAAKAPFSTGSSTKKGSTTSNPVTGVFNKVSPYGNKSQKYVSGLPKTGAASRKSNPSKPSIGEQITNVFAGRGAPKGLRANNGMNAAEVAAENKRRAAAKKK
jgi:hypothetical protein